MESSERKTAKTTIGEAATTSCERCRRRKIRCDRRDPCSRCVRAGTNCVRAGSGEKQRPAPKSYVQALESRIATLEIFISKLYAVTEDQREQMLEQFRAGADYDVGASQGDVIANTGKGLSPASSEGQSGSGKASMTRTRAGHMRRKGDSTTSQFYGGTSLFHVNVPGEDPPQITTDNGLQITKESPMGCDGGLSAITHGSDMSLLNTAQAHFLPHDEVSQRLMSCYFKYQYQYVMCVYREFFLRDYDIGAGRYYSDLLLYSICSVGALVSETPSDRLLSGIFASQAEALLWSSLDNPDLTVLQSLVLLGQREIGQCRPSRGWLYCGMAFRLAHEMGLHLDPENWNSAVEPDTDREIQRRIYWAVFIVDKQLSLYFGRPPALYPQESDVRNAVRIPYPPEWEVLLDTYIAPGISVTAFEDGIAFVGAFIYLAELSKIQHSIITDLFENRRANADDSMISATVQRLHVSLTKWLASLPTKLFWNQWTIGHVSASVLLLHMRFHTTMIILHRPPQHLLNEPETSSSESVEVCFESLQAIVRLLKTFARFDKYEHLPLDFLHVLSTAASVVLMKQHFDAASGGDSTLDERSLRPIQEAMRAVKDVHPCVVDIENCVTRAVQKSSGDSLDMFPMLELELMDWSFRSDYNGQTQDDFGLLLTEQVLGGTLPLTRSNLGQL